MKPLRNIADTSPPIIFARTFRISEFVAITAASVLSVLFIAICLKVVFNERLIHRTTRALIDKRSNRIVLTAYNQQLTEKVMLADVLSSIAGAKLPRNIIVNLAEIVYDNSSQFGYDPLLLLAVIQVESVFDSTALGRYRDGAASGARGLMQLKIETAREVAAQLGMPPLQSSDLFRPDINIILGVSYLAKMISTFKSFKLGLLAYNQGPATVKRQLAKNQPLSIRYYKKVLDAYYRLYQLSKKSAPLAYRDIPVNKDQSYHE